VLREARYFVEDLGATTLVVLGLVLGLALGGFATYRLTEGTPYSQADLDRAGAARPAEQAPAPVVATTDPTAELKAQRLSSRLREVRQDLVAANLRGDKLRQKLARTTTSLDDVTREQRRSTRTSETDVEGALVVTWELGPEQQPWPTGCADVLSRYQVSADDGSGADALVAEVTGATQVARTVQDETLTLSCRGTWTLTVEGTSGAVYGFSAAARDTPARSLATSLASAADLEGGEGPTLAVSL